jgi:hypothetical protein
LKSAAERISRLVRLTTRALRFLPVTSLLPRGVAAIRCTSPLPLERIVWLLDVARRYSPARSTCLKDALVLVRMLRAEGVDATLSIGVARGDGALRAHAWVERRGRIVFGAVEAERYVPLAGGTGPPSPR